MISYLKKIPFMMSIMAILLLINGCACTNNSADMSNDISASYTYDGHAIVSKDLYIDYKESDIYSKQDMDDAIDIIISEFTSWDGNCVLLSISYTSDECNSDDNISWMNTLVDSMDSPLDFTQCICFESDFSYPVNDNTPDANEIVCRNYQWYLARVDGSGWHLISFGY